MSVEKDKYSLWPEFYTKFSCFSDQTVRPGCHPRKLVHDNRAENAMVLVHGLTDSPFYMTAIAEYLHKFLGYNVYMPLLHYHGLKYPEGMAGVSLTQWKNNVRFAVSHAAESAERVSIGGFSTGGALAFYFGCTDPAISGDIYLFSAALGLYGGGSGVLSGIIEFLLRSPVVGLLDSRKLLAGSHPYRYDRVPLNSAGVLARLIQEINGLLKSRGDIIQKKRIFAAWSEFDRVINLRKLSGLQSVIKENQFVPFVIPKAACVEHACVVLKEPVYAIGRQPGEAPLEEANPLFAEMMVAVRSFQSAA